MTRSRASTIVCDVGAVVAEAASVDALARLQLNAQRLGLEIRLLHASSALQELIAFAGLDEVLRLEAQGQAEEREESRGVEEEAELDDPAGL